MKKIVMFGECMLEFAPVASDRYSKGIAGDVYNTGVYLQRLTQQQVALFTAVGNDAVSNGVLQNFQQEGLNLDYVFRHPDRTVGAYMIETSASGERSFVYWREHSAARHSLSLLPEQTLQQLVEETQCFYFSGISLAILQQDPQREKFWQLLSQMQQAGVQIAFDSNFRPRLWPDKTQAIAEFEQALSYSDLVFAGVEDMQQLGVARDFATVASYLQPFAINEAVIKNGEHGVQIVANGRETFVPVQAVEKVVDTTSAGDSFNAAYIDARLRGRSEKEAVLQGNRLAAEVIQHPGAIIPQQQFQAIQAKLQQPASYPS